MKFFNARSMNSNFFSSVGLLVVGIMMMVLLYLFTVASSNAKNAESSELPEPITVIAKVNGKEITSDKIEPQLKTRMRKFRKFGMQHQNEDLIKSMKLRALNEYIDMELLYQEAMKTEVADLDKKIDSKMKEAEEQVAKYKKEMKESEIRKAFERQIAVEEYLVKNDLKDPELPESVIKEYYETNKNNFKRNEMVWARHILIKVNKDMTEEEKKAARQKIEKARKLIVEGKSFDEVAKEYSQCNSASGGGKLTYNERGYMPPEFDEVAFSMKIGKLSKIFKTEHGYHVLEVLGRKEAGIIPYEEIKSFIGKYLKNQHARKKMTAHIQSLKEKATIEVYL